MKYNICKIISIISVAPLIAFYVLSAIYLSDKSIFNGITWYIVSLIFLTFIPLSAYGIKNLIPSIKGQGRSGERKLAFIMCVTGYVLGTIVCFIFSAPSGVKLVFISYLISGGLLAFINKVIKLKASGHACGIAGPYVLLLYFIGKSAWFSILLLIPIYWARKNMERHTYRELITGTIVGIVATAVTVFVYTLI